MASEVYSFPRMLIRLVWSFMMSLNPWTYAYQSNVFYHGHNSMFKTQSSCLVVASYLCLVLLGYLGEFLFSRALNGYP